MLVGCTMGLGQSEVIKGCAESCCSTQTCSPRGSCTLIRCSLTQMSAVENSVRPNPKRCGVSSME